MAFVMTGSEWRDFEKLIFRLLLDEYGIEESQINHLTQSTKDGGYDGIFFIPCFTGDQVNDGEYLRVLFEAKLRSDVSHALPLQDFSKALIVSINKNADRLIIATNLYFSQGTIDTLREYSDHTGMEIRFLTSYDIYQWLQNGGSESVKPLLESPDLLDFLKESYAKVRDRAKISSEKSIYRPVPDIPSIKLIGAQRKTDLASAVAAFQKAPSIITVEGEAGIGKSVFTNQVLLEMGRTKRYNIQKIDIEYFKTPRLLFMKLLDHIWHVPFHILNSLDKEAVEDVVRWIGDRETPEEMRKTLTAAFCRSADDYHRFSDLFNYYLAEYVCQIYGMAKARKMPLLCFTNINYADDDLLQFLLLLIKKFDGDICILLELRTSLYIDGHVSERTWTNFLSSIYQMPNLRLRIELEEWEADETAEYIRQKARPMKLSLNCVRSIQQRVGCNPLHLDTFLSYICMAAEADIPSSYLEEYIINCPIENIDDVIFRLIERVTRSLPCAGAIFFFLGMLSGQASEEVLEDCVGRSIHETLDRLATETPLLWRGGSEIHISHSLYLAAVQRTNYISAFQKQELASRLLERLDGLSMDALHSGSVRVELLQILKEFDLAATHAFELAEDLFRDGQYQASYRYYTVARTCLNKLYACPEDLLFRCMLGQIRCRLQLENFTEEELEQSLKDCQDTLELCPASGAAAAVLRVEYLMAKNQFFHYFGRFQESLETVRETLSLLYRAKCPETELLGSAWAEYGIAVKETFSLQQALSVFRKASVVCPGSNNLRFALYTHMSENYSAFDPEKARDYLIQASELEPFLNYSERMHNRVNLATNRFYCGEYQEARVEGIRLLRSAYTFGINNEEGRLANLLGCVELHDGKADEAEKYFRRGISIFHGENYVAYLWPILANLSTLYFLRGSYSESFDMIRKCAAIFRTSFLSRIRRSPWTGSAGEKLHIALLAIVGTLWELPLPGEQKQGLLAELYEIADGSSILEALCSIRMRSDAVALSCSSTFCVDGEIYIKD